MSKIIQIASAITVKKNVPEVFSFLADLRNDAQWRREIQDVFLENPKKKLATLALETSFLSHQKPKNQIMLKCIELVENNTISYESILDSAFYTDNQARLDKFLNNALSISHQEKMKNIFKVIFYVKNTRKVTYLSENESKIDYQIDFDIDLIKYALGFSLPTFFVKYYTKSVMNSYLRKLKKVLEDKNRITWHI